MNLNPLSWPILGKAAAVAVLAAGAGSGVALAMNHGQTQLSPAAPSNAPVPASNSAPLATPADVPGMSTFICSGGSSASLLQWQDSSGDLSGSYEYSSISGQAPQEQVTSNRGGLSGTLNENAISLSIGLQEPLYGTLNGGQLTLNIPQADGSFQAGTCSSGSLSDWNSTVQALDSQAASDNNTALQQQAQASSQAAQQQAQQQHDDEINRAQQALSSDISTLEGDASTLNSDTTLSGDISTMKSDYQTEQSDYQTELSDGCPAASGDASAVGSDASAIDSDQSAMQSDIQPLQGSSGIAGIQTDISTVNGDISTLQGLGASPAEDPSQAIALGEKAISNANAAIQWAIGQAKSIDAQAHQLAQTAENWASQHGCP